MMAAEEKLENHQSQADLSWRDHVAMAIHPVVVEITSYAMSLKSVGFY